MIILLIIYLLGCIVAFIFQYNNTLNKWGEITINDIVFSFLVSLFSWISLVIELSEFYGDKVVVSKKSKKHDTRR